MSTPKDFEIRWHNRLQFRVLAIFLGMFILAMLTIIIIANTLGENLIERQAYLKLSDAGHRVVSELESRTVQAASLADSIAKIGSNLPVDKSEFGNIIKQIMNHEGTRHLVAGGGVWPEPYKFRADRERDSFFWGRNPQGLLEFYNDYNEPGGMGYHHEEWYVPTKYLPPGEVYWSKSYTDPHSLQPMVTVSAPMIRQGQNIGVATIDLKLEGLRELLEEATREFGGYAFAVDRNGRFLSFPNNNLAKNLGTVVESGSLIPFINIEELAQRKIDFQPFMELLGHHADLLPSSLPGGGTQLISLANSLAAQSYQIEKPEALIIAATLLKSSDEVTHLDFDEQHTGLQQDYFLKEPVFVSITTMPGTYWQVVTVMPQSAARKDAVGLFNLLIGVTLVAVLATMALVWGLLRFNLTQPLIKLAEQLKHSFSDDDQVAPLIETRDRGELGALAHWFNLRSEQLLKSQKQIKHLAFYDALTDLPNRRLLMDRLSQKLAVTKRRGRRGALLFIDLDNFKDLNDSLGHSVGDELLIQVSRRLKFALREEDTIARLGGDEFVVMAACDDSCPRASVGNAAAVAERLIGEFSKPFDLSGTQHHISASIGISLFPNEQQDVEEILKQADTAMYQAKANGRNNFCFFETDMQQRADERLRIQEQLRHAITGNQLALFYQPQIDADGSCRSAEALVRWLHPEEGLIPPNEFIPIAEESSLILALGGWVLYEACRQISCWNVQGLKLQHVSVNVSPRQFQQSDFIDVVKSAIEQTNIRPEQLMLEITEGVVFENTEAAITKMHDLRALGVSISLDDFGTGYSSLTYLKKLPLDQLKIDQSFVRDVATEKRDAVIIESIISMAQQLGYEVIAEGVETEGQQMLLRSKGCLHYQGYYYSPPLEVSGFVEYMQQSEAFSY